VPAGARPEAFWASWLVEVPDAELIIQSHEGYENGKNRLPESHLLLRLL
jgi:hypothetical protein